MIIRWMGIMMIVIKGLNGFSQEMSMQHIMEYPQHIFDSDTCCWRTLSKNEKYREAAGLIQFYLKTNQQIANKHSLHWHLGQMLAMARDDQEAIRYFKKTYDGLFFFFSDADGKAWYKYAKGTVSFLERNRERLIHMIQSWPEKNLPHKNFEVLSMLLDHWELPYREATRGGQVNK